METLYTVTRVLHVVGGAIGLLALLPPLLARKGGTIHRRAGWVFVGAMALAALSGIAISVAWIVAPEAFVEGERTAQAIAWRRGGGMFLGTIGLLALASMRSGLRALHRKRSREPNRHPFDLGLYLLLLSSGVVTLISSSIGGQALPAVFSLIAVITAVMSLRFALSPLAHPKAWLAEHIGAMGGAAIAAVTAFAVFGSSRWLGSTIRGPVAWVAWLAPSAVGTVLILRAQLRLRRTPQRTGAIAALGGEDRLAG